ncbi:hypothetical protein AB0469_37830 [Streptomyces sp. NPDC093801]|uniref:hypothetical protein n=1 Tax=Streptomyces sp. NPDC093801 TaxID=3155203 RepID=UPI00344C609B
MSRPWPTRLSAADLADYLQAQAEHEAEMRELADREFQIETGQIDSYSDYRFTWEDDALPPDPPKPATDSPGAEVRRSLPPGMHSQDAPPF